MKKVFQFEFDDESAAETGRNHDGITYEYSAEEDERLRIEVVNGVPFLFANASGRLMLAKILVKIALGKYKSGFHVHLHQDFNADSTEILTVGLSNSN